MGVRVGKILFAFLEIILSVFCFLLFILLVFPLMLIFTFIPCLLWRGIMMVYVKLFRKDIVRIMGGKNPVLAVDDIHGRPLSSIVGMGAFHGADVESASKFVLNVVNSIDQKTGKFLYPETHQYYEEWMGFFWWKWVENYNAKDYIKVWEPSEHGEISEDEFIRIVGILEAMPFERKKSPWEVYLVKNLMLKNVKEPEIPKIAVVFRFHHGLADGIAMLQVFMEYVFDDSFDKVVRPQYVQRNECQKKIHKALATLQLPYQFFKQGISAFDVNAWHLAESKLSRKVFKAWSKRIPTDLIKDIKVQYKVGFTAVLIGVISAALRNMMIKNNVKVPRKLHAILPLPWPKHPKKFCNHWSYGFMRLPVGVSEGRKRLRKAHNSVEELKLSPSPVVNFVLLSAFNLLPTWLIKRTTVTNYFPTVILSNFPGPPNESNGVGGFPLVDTMFTGGPLRGNIGISITILSYSGALRIVCGVDKSIFPTQEMTNELIAEIEAEFYRLRDEERV